MYGLVYLCSQYNHQQFIVPTRTDLLQIVLKTDIKNPQHSFGDQCLLNIMELNWLFRGVLLSSLR